MSAGRSAHEQKDREIAAGDQQQHGDRAEQHIQPSANTVAHDFAFEREEGRAPALVVLGQRG